MFSLNLKASNGWREGCRRPAANSRERGLTGSGILMLIVGTALVLLCGWLASSDSSAMEEESRAYARHSIERLAFAHDAQYLAANLSPAARPLYPADRQRYAFACLTKLGVPSGPVKLEGTLSRGTEPGDHDPRASFSSHVRYPKADAHFYLNVACRHGQWQIDYFAFDWQDNAGAPAEPSL